MNHKAFTLIDLLVVVAIIGILAAVGVVAYNGYTASAKKAVVKTTLKQIEKYINNDMIHFSKYDNDRSIPNLCDGLKISLRKI